jgi:hypothetical protein
MQLQTLRDLTGLNLKQQQKYNLVATYDIVIS